jgi:hypothetical protein
MSLLFSYLKCLNIYNRFSRINENLSSYQFIVRITRWSVLVAPCYNSTIVISELAENYWQA